ncbi:MAG TPA: GNAT family N-acetyltransferase [Candidatus Enterousia intestinigallinarum]|uniref:L-ornithine N(alpha)-acyltransferase n=1 Tax=Candidatus Enterousia intestinigallinarum TaxID=2840790 RepID=A0A9D1JWH9_9PROT|nr:GNAT family N-acetyltransferase [Candidatus Enterousia intestinigallinarum]
MAIKVRDYEVRLTRNKDERRQVRQLRYDVFVEEEGASATEEQRNLREEYDSFDRYAEYLAVFHNGKIVGTYRIIDRNAAEKMDGFYTESEFNISKIKKVDGNIAEMSRACVNREYRDNALVMRLLWAGLGEYIVRRKIAILFGVASWVGTKPVESAQAISYLYYNHLSPLGLRATVLSENFAPDVNPKLSRMNILPREFVDEADARRQMTPLIKGYLRLGATFGRGVFIDKSFNSYDVFVMVQTKKIDAAYQKHFLGRENALEHLDVRDGTLKTVGKIMLLPVTGSYKVFRAFFEFLLREDAADVEYIDDSREENGDKE